MFIRRPFFRHGSIALALGLTRREVELALEHVEELLVARLNPDGAPDAPRSEPD